jgi:hypothetical protein
MSDRDKLNPYASPVAADAALIEPDTATNFASLQITGLGLRLHYAGLLVVILTILSTFLFGWFLGIGTFMYALLWARMALMLVGVGLFLIGPLLCLGVPADTKARPYIVLSAVTGVVTAAITFFPAYGDVYSVVSIILPQMVSATASLFFMLFLIRLAQYLELPGMARRGKIIIGLSLILFVGSAVAIGSTFVNFSTSQVAGSLATILPVIWITITILGLVTFVMYANLVNALAKYIRSYGRIAPPKHLG